MRYERENEGRREMREVGRERKHEKKVKRKKMGPGLLVFIYGGLHALFSLLFLHLVLYTFISPYSTFLF